MHQLDHWEEALVRNDDLGRAVLKGLQAAAARVHRKLQDLERDQLKGTHGGAVKPILQVVRFEDIPELLSRLIKYYQLEGKLDTSTDPRLKRHTLARILTELYSAVSNSANPAIRAMATREAWRVRENQFTLAPTAATQLDAASAGKARDPVITTASQIRDNLAYMMADFKALNEEAFKQVAQTLQHAGSGMTEERAFGYTSFADKGNANKLEQALQAVNAGQDYDFDRMEVNATGTADGQAAFDAINITLAPKFLSLTPPEQAELTQFVDLVKNGSLRLYIPDLQRVAPGKDKEALSRFRKQVEQFPAPTRTQIKTFRALCTKAGLVARKGMDNAKRDRDAGSAAAAVGEGKKKRKSSKKVISDLKAEVAALKAAAAEKTSAEKDKGVASASIPDPQAADETSTDALVQQVAAAVMQKHKVDAMAARLVARSKGSLADLYETTSVAAMASASDQPVSKKAKFEVPKGFLGINAIGTNSEGKDWGLLSTWEAWKAGSDREELPLDKKSTRTHGAGLHTDGRVEITRTKTSSAPVGTTILMTALGRASALTDGISEPHPRATSWTTLALILSIILAIVVGSCTLGVGIGYVWNSLGDTKSSPRTYDLSMGCGGLTPKEPGYCYGTLYDPAGNQIGHREGNQAGASVSDRFGRYVGYLADDFRKETEVVLMRWEEPTLGLAPLGVATRMMESWNELEVIRSELEVGALSQAPPITPTRSHETKSVIWALVA